MTDVQTLTKAFLFATEKHKQQRRKGEAGETYVLHLAEVADLVSTATIGNDLDLVIAALLHDTIEDTGTTAKELRECFGDDVTDLVLEVTDDKELPKKVRKALQVAKAGEKTDRAKVLKLADKTSNLRSITNSPPADWSADRKREYVDWARRVTEGLSGVNPWIEGQFDKAAERADNSCQIAA